MVHAVHVLTNSKEHEYHYYVKHFIFWCSGLLLLCLGESIQWNKGISPIPTFAKYVVGHRDMLCCIKPDRLLNPL